MKALLTTILLLIACQATATNQLPDKLIYKGEEHYFGGIWVLDCFMCAYFKKYPDRKPIDEVNSTALLRGYVATYEIKDKQLFLKDIVVRNKESTNSKDMWKSVMSTVLGPLDELKIDWLSGLHVFPYDDMVDGNVKDSTTGRTLHKKYIVLNFRNGDVVLEKEYTTYRYQKCVAKHFEWFVKEGLYYREANINISRILFYKQQLCSLIQDPKAVSCYFKY